MQQPELAAPGAASAAVAQWPLPQAGDALLAALSEPLMADAAAQPAGPTADLLGGGAAPLPGWGAAFGVPFPPEHGLPDISGLSFGGIAALGSLSGVSGTGASLSLAGAGAGTADTAAALPARRRGSSRPQVSEEERQERARAVNRAKQARWRERQKVRARVRGPRLRWYKRHCRRRCPAWGPGA